MDAAVKNTEKYYQRFSGDRTCGQLVSHIISVLNRKSKQQFKKKREIPHGSLSDLEILAAASSPKPEIEQRILIAELLAQLSERSRVITFWRQEGHSWRQIAKKLGSHYTTVRRVYRSEIDRVLSAILQIRKDDASLK
jgi:DNA-directed RNA polymerase specialized sigma24 family protein